jgi:hypothetical protein
MEEIISDDDLSIPPPTVPNDFQISLLGFPDETEAREFGNHIGEIIRVISSFINLGRLDGVTIAYEYEKALANLDRGCQPSKPLTRTDDGFLCGVAMAPTVIRDGIVKGHLVFFTPAVLPLQLESGEDYNQALYTVAHECGHIDDLKFQDECFPGTILQEQYSNQEEALLRQTAEVVWQEYSACRKSAVFGRGQTASYEEGFVTVVTDARDKANAAIRLYRLHSDIDRVVEEAGHCLCEPLRMAAYLIGHLDGIGDGWDAVPTARTALENSTYLPFVDSLTTVLRNLYSQRALWSSKEVYSPLCDIVRDVLAHGDLIVKKLSDDSLYVDIPFTPDTLP